MKITLFGFSHSFDCSFNAFANPIERWLFPMPGGPLRITFPVSNFR
nr:MAG TPA: hypothetical protein [Caudoviricetes sp.]